MAYTKIKAFELAKKRNMPCGEMIKILGENGMEIKSNFTGLTQDDVTRAINILESLKEPVETNVIESKPRLTNGQTLITFGVAQNPTTREYEVLTIETNLLDMSSNVIARKGFKGSRAKAELARDQYQVKYNTQQRRMRKNVTRFK